ncbi:hypothetical protein C9426_24660 [Serratia sp. S1B]|nr:hypothetical protein C9426_24660 [Serratia sp. S1B]
MQSLKNGFYIFTARMVIALLCSLLLAVSYSGVTAIYQANYDAIRHDIASGITINFAVIILSFTYFIIIFIRPTLGAAIALCTVSYLYFYWFTLLPYKGLLMMVLGSFFYTVIFLINGLIRKKTSG